MNGNSIFLDTNKDYSDLFLRDLEKKTLHYPQCHSEA